MKYEFSKIISDVQRLSQIRKRIKEIDKEKENRFLNSEYYKTSKPILAELSVGEKLDIRKKSYDEWLSMIEELLDMVIKNSDEVLSESELSEYKKVYEENAEIRQMYPSFDDLIRSVSEERKQLFRKRKENLITLINNFKGLKSASDYISVVLLELDKKKEELIKEEEKLTELIPKNCNMELLENGIEYNKFGFPIIKDDMELVNKNPMFNDSINLDDLIMVHTTKYFPQDGIVKSARDAIGLKRNTVHTSLNGRVESHELGNWGDSLITILDPLKNHIDQVASLYSVDTFTYGSVQLSSSAIILIDSSIFEDIYQKNKEYIEKNRERIILYSGDSTIVVNRLLGLLGYVPELMSKWRWANEEDDNLFNTFVAENYPNKQLGAHYYTPYKHVEQNTNREEALNSLGIVDNGDDMVIGLNVLYTLREYNKKIPTKDFIKNVGISVMDNEIHLLGIKDHLQLMQQAEVSPFQVEKVDMLIEKYKLMLEKELIMNGEENHTKQA